MKPPRLALVGHVEHIALGQVSALPARGEIAHLDSVREFPGGGGGIAVFQMRRGPGEVHAFTALGNDDAAKLMRTRMEEAGIEVHAAIRESPHTRDLVLLTPDGERTILVIGQPLQPQRTDALPWELLSTCDAVYFTAEDPQALAAARQAKILVVTSRRRHVLAAAGIRADVVVGSADDPRERSRLSDYPIAPAALVMTEGAAGGSVHTAEGTFRFPPSAPPEPVRSSYGAGDSFAGALTAYLGAGFDLAESCARAARHGAAVLAGPDPLSAQLPLGY
jgi:ribokinase